MSMVQLQDPDTGSSAKILIDQGFNCFEFLAILPNGQVVDVLAASEDFPGGTQPVTHHGNPLLFPYPNRIEAGRFSWEGTEYRLTPDQVLFDPTGNAIHGFCLDRPWRILEQSQSAVTGAFRLSLDAPDRSGCWPSDPEIQVSYELKGSCLCSVIRVLNSGDRSMPWGFGTHAYFRIPLSRQSTAEQCRIVVPATSVWELEQCLPTGTKTAPPQNAVLEQGRAFDGLRVDDIYSDVISRNGIITCRILDPAAGAKVEQRCSDDFRELVVFTPPWSSSICMEPYTCVTNAVNLEPRGIDAGLRVLQPGEEWTGWIDIEASEL